VWEYAAFVANSLIFLLIGLSMHLSVIGAHVGLVLIAFVVVVAARAVVVYGYGLDLAPVRRRPAVPLAARARLGRPARHDRLWRWS
jgi:CPA1 family monovalent cation:H+ antiporter